MLMLIVSFMISASSEPASKPTDTDPVIAPLQKILEEIRDEGCGNSYECWKRSTMRLYSGMSTSMHVINLRFISAQLDKRSIDTITEQANLYRGLFDMTKKTLLDSVKPAPWWKEPVLWVFVGVVSGIALTVGVLAGSAQLVKALTH